MSRRVVLVGALPPPIGGVSVHCERAVERLAAAGFDVAFLNLRPGRRSPGEIRGLRAWLHLIGARRRRTPVVVHHSASVRRVPTLGLVLAVRCLRRRQVALVQHSGGFAEVVSSDRPLVRRLHTALARGASVAWCVTAADERRYRELAPRLDTVAAPSFLANAALDERRTVPVEREPVIVTSGYVTPLYGFDGVVEAFRTARVGRPRAHLEIFTYGPVDEPYQRRLVDLIGDDESITIRRDASPADFHAALHRASLYVRNTSSDSYGVAVAEALFLGTACLATDVCARAPGCLTFRPGDLDRVASLMGRALDGELVSASVPDDGFETYLRLFGRLGSDAGAAVEAEPADG